MEKGYRHWGDDLGDEDTPLEAGLGFSVAWNKPHGFIGREALLERKQQGIQRRLVCFALEEADALLYHNEPVWRDEVRVGRVTSGMFGHTLGRSLALGYVSNPGGSVSADWLASGRFEIEVARRRLPCIASLRPFYDPQSARVRS
jgi:glycine cleavage system aminomethyltransferase T